MAVKKLSSFVASCCLTAENARYPALELYLTYVNWCINVGAPVLDQFTFLDRLQESGVGYRQRGSWFQGITVLPQYRVE